MISLVPHTYVELFPQDIHTQAYELKYLSHFNSN